MKRHFHVKPLFSIIIQLTVNRSPAVNHTVNSDLSEHVYRDCLYHEYCICIRLVYIV